MGPLPNPVERISPPSSGFQSGVTQQGDRLAVLAMTLDGLEIANNWLKLLKLAESKQQNPYARSDPQIRVEML
jgi:hypothetical protein